jgi:hypothetical protein
MSKRWHSDEDVQALKRRCTDVATEVLEVATAGVKRAAQFAGEETKRARHAKTPMDEVAENARMFLRGVDFFKTHVLPEMLKRQAEDMAECISQQRRQMFLRGVAWNRTHVLPELLKSQHSNFSARIASERAWWAATFDRELHSATLSDPHWGL